MNAEPPSRLANTERKLALVEDQIAQARSRSDSAENAESIRSLVQMANQLKEEIVRYRSLEKRRPS